MRKTVFPLSLILCVIVLTGCMQAQAATVSAGTGIAAEHALDIPEVSPNEVRISRSLNTGRINPNVYGKFGQDKEKKTFLDAYRTARKRNGELNVIAPDYDIVYQSDGSVQAWHLWLPRTGTGEGMLMEAADTSTGYQLTAEATENLRSFIGGLHYDSEQAVANGDIVQWLNRIENFDAWERFEYSVRNRQPDSVQYVTYTIEGDPIFANLDFDGQRIRYSYDTTHDKFGSSEKEVMTCEKIVDEPLTEAFGGPGTLYRLGGCSDSNGENGWQFRFAVPDNAQK